MKRCSLFFLLVLMFAATHAGGRVVRLFSIGNSFSEDAVEQYLYELAAAQGDSQSLYPVLAELRGQFRLIAETQRISAKNIF